MNKTTDKMKNVTTQIQSDHKIGYSMNQFAKTNEYIAKALA